MTRQSKKIRRKRLDTAKRKQKERRREESRAVQQAQNTEQHKRARQNTEYREVEQMRNTVAHQRTKQQSHSVWKQLLNQFERLIEQGAENVCCICSGMFYQSSMRVVSHECESQRKAMLEQALSANCRIPHQFCLTCYESVNHGKIPTLSHVNGLFFPQVPDVLKNLTDLEERLVAARIPFMQIRSLGSGGQFGLHGNVVNVVNDIALCTSSILLL